VHETLLSLQTGPNAYYAIRESKPKYAVDRAARFVYLNRFCFNGLYRTNRLGQFNVPYGRPKNFNVPTADQFLACAAMLRRAELRAADFRDVLSAVGASDFVYLDPPYATTSRRTFVEYQKDSFSQADVADLVGCLQRIDRTGAVFLLSYAYTAEARSHFSRWSQKRLSVHRNVAGFSGARRKQYELLVSNRTFHE
jgi:DNA adenine methylase